MNFLAQPVADPAPQGDRIVAVANQKGGVGKSTTVVNLGAWLALEGARVLLIDLDPQANASTGVGIDPRRASGNIYQVLVADLPLEDAIEATAVKNLFCVPSTIDLAGAEIELVAAFSRELKLKKALETGAEEFDYVFIDCPPSLGLLTVNALAAANEVLVPIQCEFYALEGLGQLLNNVNLVHSSLNPGLRLTGIVLTMYDGRTKLAEQVAAEVRGHFPGKVYSSVIPRNVRLSEAPSFGQPVALYDPRSAGSIAYRNLAVEMKAGPGLIQPLASLPDEVEQSFGEGTGNEEAIPVTHRTDESDHSMNTSVLPQAPGPSDSPVAPAEREADGLTPADDVISSEAPSPQAHPEAGADVQKADWR